VLLLLLLTAVAPARAQSGATAVLNGQSTSAGADALTLTLYFSLQDAAGRPLPDVVVAADGSVLLEEGGLYPARVEKTPAYVVLALDASGSMSPIFEDVRQEALAIVENAPPGTQFAVIRFDDRINLDQSFTGDKAQTAAALRGIELGENGTCIDDVGYTAVQTLAQIAPGSPSRAVILFSDGAKPAQAQESGNCGLYSYEQTRAYAAAENTPIYAIGNNAIKETELALLAENSGGAVILLGAERLPEQRQMMLDRVNSRWQAHADLRPVHAVQRGMLLLLLDTGEPLLPLPFLFTTPTTYEAPETDEERPLRLEIGNFRHTAPDKYELDVTIDPAAALLDLEVEVVDSANTQVGLAVVPNPLPTQRVTFSAAEWPPGAYTVRARGRQNGLIVRDADGAPVQSLYPFQHQPPQPVSLRITAVRVDEEPARLNLRTLKLEDDLPELAVRLRLENGEEAASFAGVLIRQSSNQQAAQFPVEVALDGGLGTARIPAALEEGGYILALEALDEAGERLAADSATFTYIAPDGALIRAGKAMRENVLLPFFLLATAVFAGLVAWYTGQRAGRRRAAAGQGGGLDLSALPPPESAAEETQPVLLTLAESPDGALAAGQQWQITTFPFVIGREGCDLTIANDYHVSRRHAQITRSEDAYFLEDLGSANGTFLNATQLTPREPIALNAERGERITIGKTTTLLFGETETETETETE
jgi:Mg-chelatase subunit ChlD